MPPNHPCAARAPAERSLGARVRLDGREGPVAHGEVSLVSGDTTVERTADHEGHLFVALAPGETVEVQAEEATLTLAGVWGDARLATQAPHPGRTDREESIALRVVHGPGAHVHPLEGQVIVHDPLEDEEHFLDLVDGDVVVPLRSTIVGTTSYAVTAVMDTCQIGTPADLGFDVAWYTPHVSLPAPQGWAGDAPLRQLLTGNGTLQWRLGQGAWNETTQVVVPEGVHTVEARSLGPDGTVDARVSHTYRVDATPPTAPTALAATVDRARVDLSWTAASDAGSGIAHYEVERWDGTRWVEAVRTPSTTAHHVPVNTTDAVVPLRVRAVDVAGQRGPPTPVVDVVVDGAAPHIVPLFEPPLRLGREGTVVFEVTDTHEVDVVATWNGRPADLDARHGIVRLSVADLAPGTNHLRLVAADVAGNRAHWSGAITLDPGLPALEGIRWSPTWTDAVVRAGAALELEVQVIPGEAAVAGVHIEGVAFDPLPLVHVGNDTWSRTLTLDASEDPARWHLVATTVHGDQTTPQRIPWRIDRAPPVWDGADAVPAHVRPGARLPVQVEDDTGLASVSWHLDGTPLVAPILHAVEVPVWPDGMHTLSLEAVDLAGRTLRAERIVHIDGTPPSLQVDWPATALLERPAPVHARDAWLDRVEAQRDDGSWVPLGDALQPHGGERVGRVTVRAADRAGNSVTDDRWVIEDATPPRIDFVLPDGARVHSGRIPYAIEDGTLAWHQVRLNGVPQDVAAVGTLDVVAAGPGRYRIAIDAVDAAGQRNSVTREVVVPQTMASYVVERGPRVAEGYEVRIVNATGDDVVHGATLELVVNGPPIRVPARSDGGDWVGHVPVWPAGVQAVRVVYLDAQGEARWVSVEVPLMGPREGHTETAESGLDLAAAFVVLAGCLGWVAYGRRHRARTPPSDS